MITKDNIKKTEQVLVDNGIQNDEADTVLEAIGYTLLDTNLYDEEWNQLEGNWFLLNTEELDIIRYALDFTQRYLGEVCNYNCEEKRYDEQTIEMLDDLYNKFDIK